MRLVARRAHQQSKDNQPRKDEQRSGDERPSKDEHPSKDGRPPEGEQTSEGERSSTVAGPEPGGKAFAIVTSLPPLLLIAWLLPGLSLLLARRFVPTPTALISVPLAVALVILSARYAPAAWAVPGSGERARPGARPRRAAGGAKNGASRDEQAADGGAKKDAGRDEAADGGAKKVAGRDEAADGGDEPSGTEEAGAEDAPAASEGAEAGDEDRAKAANGNRSVSARRRSRAAWWGLAGTVVVAAGFAAWQLFVNSPQFFVDRDPGAYLQVGYWIAEHGSLPIPASLAAFGGAHPGFTFASFGFASHAGGVVPGLAPELPIVLAAGLWTHGLPGAVFVGPILGGLAVLSVGGLTGRLAGPQWAPAGALLVALTVPQVYTSRSAFGETLTQVLLFGGLCLVVDAVSSRKPAVPAALGGLSLGLAAGAGASALIVVLPVIVFVGAVAAGRRREALPFAGGLVVGAGLGLAGAIVLSFPLLGAGAPPFGVMKIVGGAVVAVTVVGAVVGLVPPARRGAGRLLAARPLRWLPGFAALAVAGLVAALAARPFLQTVRGGADAYVGYLQRLARLPVDPGRLYTEKSLYWVIWYLGVPALLLGVIGLALAVRLCLRALFTWRDPSGAARAWALPVAVIGWGLFAVLWQPYTVPDQPWASRRLVPVVLPGLVVLAVWVSARLTARARELGAGALVVSVVAACFVVAVAVPPAVITFGIRASGATTPEVRAALAGMALRRTAVGEYGAVRSLCESIPSNASVVMLDAVAAREFTPVVRGMCDVPAGVVAGSAGVVAGPGGVVAAPGGALRGAAPSQVRAVISGILRAGRRPVLLATVPAELAPYNAQARQVVNLGGDQDPHVLDRPPTSAWPVRYALWMSEPGGTPFGS